MDRDTARPPRLVYFLIGYNTRQVTLVKLHHQGKFFDIEPDKGKIFFKVYKTLAVVSCFLNPRVCDEGNPVCPCQDRLSGGVVAYLTGNRIYLQLDPEPVRGNQKKGSRSK